MLQAPMLPRTALAYDYGSPEYSFHTSAERHGGPAMLIDVVGTIYACTESPKSAFHPAFN